MMVELAEAEQKLYLPHNANNTRLPTLPAKLPNGKARQVTVVEGGYCSDVPYMEKLREKQQQHAALERALMTYGHEVVSLSYTSGCTGSQYHSSNDTLRHLGIEHAAADKLKRKIHELTITSADNLMKSRRFLQRSRNGQHSPRSDPP